jgi:hypothetical protein
MAADPDWQEIKGQHIIVYYVQDKALAEKVAQRAEDLYSKIAEDLGYTKRDKFWTWQNRAKIYIYPSRDAFNSGTGSPAWAGGKAVGKKREISTFSGYEDFLESVLPHELTHLMFRDFIGFEGDIPLWLNEGVAQWEEKANRDATDPLMLSLLKQNRLIPFDELTRIDSRNLERDGRVAEFYAQAGSLVGFLIRRHGSDGFRRLCGQIRDGKTVDDALGFAYPETIRNMKELEQTWRKYLAESSEVSP